MRGSFAALVLLGVLIAPVAAGLAVTEERSAPPSASASRHDDNRNEVTPLVDAAEEAAGLQPVPAEVAPVLAPFDGFASGLAPALAIGLGLGAAGLAAFAFFHQGARFSSPTEVLRHEIRQGIYGYLKDRTGANLKQVTDDLSLTTTNAIWHLRKLEEAGLIHSRRFNGYKVFYPAEGGVEARRLSLAKTALANPNAMEVFEQVVAQPGAHQREIARTLGVNHGTVRWHLRKLLDGELITETRRGKVSSYDPTPMGLAALQQVAAAQSTTRVPVGTAA